MTLPFLSGATGDPINSKRRVAPQAARGIPATTGFRDFRSYLGPIRINSQEIERQAVIPGGAPSANLTGKMAIEGGPLSIGDLDPANPGLVNMLANVFGRYLLTDQTTYQEWIFALDQATAADPFLTLLEDNDVLPRFRVTDLLLGGFDLQAQPGSNLAITFPFAASEFDLHGEPAQTAGSGSTLPILKRTWAGNWAEVDQDLYIRVDADNGSDADISVKVGAASAYSNQQNVIYGQWNRLQDESGARVGKIAEQVMLYWPASPTLVALDEFQVPQNRASWAQTLGVERPISSVNTTFVLDGVEIRVEGGWTVSAAWQNLNRVDDVAGRQGAFVERTGQLAVTVTPTRRLTDLTLQAAIANAQTVSIVIEAETDVEIGASGRPYRQLLICPRLTASGATYGAEAGGQNRDESLTLTAAVPESTFAYGGFNVDSHCAVILENDVAAL